MYLQDSAIYVYNSERPHAAIDYHTPDEYFYGAFSDAEKIAA